MLTSVDVTESVVVTTRCRLQEDDGPVHLSVSEGEVATVRVILPMEDARSLLEGMLDVLGTPDGYVDVADVTPAVELHYHGEVYVVEEESWVPACMSTTIACLKTMCAKSAAPGQQMRILDRNEAVVMVGICGLGGSSWALG